MNINHVNKTKYILEALDWIPIVSTATNLVHIFMRTFFTIDPNTDYGQYLQRGFEIHVINLIPGLNIWMQSDLFLAKCKIVQDKKGVLAEVAKSGSIRRLSADHKNDKEIVLAAVRKNGEAIKNAPAALQDDEEIVLAAMETYIAAVAYASQRVCDLPIVAQRLYDLMDTCSDVRDYRTQ